MEYFQLANSNRLLTPEMKARRLPYVDPIGLNYKIIFDYGSDFGLFADEKYTNSALAYLKRVGQEERHQLLKKWIELFKVVFKDFEFLFQELSGLETIVNKPLGHLYPEDNSDDPITITIRETSDLIIQSLLTTYRHIIFDTERQVEVLPTNLRQFDMSVLVFSTGYYDMLFYDNFGKDFESGSSDIEKFIFPTIDKLEKVETHHKYFNHTIFKMQGVRLKPENMLGAMFSEVTNGTPSENVKTTIAFTYKKASFSGMYNNTIGNFDPERLLAYASVYNKAINFQKADNSFRGKFKKLISNYKEQLDSWKNADLISNVKTDIQSLIESRLSAQLSKAANNSTPIGNLINSLTPENARSLVQRTFASKIHSLEDKYINEPLTRLNNLLLNNFNIHTFNGFSGVKNEKNQKPNIEYKDSENIYNLSNNSQKENITLIKKENIYKKSTF